MNYIELKQHIILYRTQLDSIQSISLLDKIRTSYAKWVLDQLIPIFAPDVINDKQNKTILDNLELFLKQNWDLVKSTPCCYTAMPTDNITLLLCDIAAWVAEQKNKRRDSKDNPVHAISLLMPSIALNSQLDAYPDLHASVGFSLLKGSSTVLRCCFSELSGALGGKDGFVLLESDSPNNKSTLYFVQNTTQNIQKVTFPVTWLCAQVLSKSPSNAEIEQVIDGNKILFIRRNKDIIVGYRSFDEEYTEKKIEQAKHRELVNTITKYTNGLINNQADLNVVASFATQIGMNTELLTVEEGDDSAKLKENFQQLKSKFTDAVTFAEEDELELIASVTGRSPNISLKRILRTHILGQDGLYLIPVRVLTNVNLVLVSQPIIKPYICSQLEDNPEAYYILESEHSRLVSHSELTQAVLKARQDYEREVRMDPSTLLNQLTLLCQQFYLNGAEVTGRHFEADGGAYAAYITFREYFEQLSKDDQDKIPENLMNEINLLHALTTDKVQNEAGVVNLNVKTCVASRRAAIMRTMSGHEPLLGAISLKISTKMSAANLRAIKNNFDASCRHFLREISVAGYYLGQDQFCINLELLKKLTIQAILNTSPKVSSSAEFKLAIVSVSEKEQNIVVEAMQDNWQDIVHSLNDFKWAMQTIPTTHRDHFFNLVAARLPNYIHSINNMSEFNELLVMSQHVVALKKIVFESMRDNWQNIVHSLNDFKWVMQTIPTIQHDILFNHLKTRLPNLIHSINDFTTLHNLLSARQRVVAFNLLLPILLNIIQSSDDYQIIVASLQQDERNRLWLAMSAAEHDVWLQTTHATWINAIKKSIVADIIEIFRSEWYEAKRQDVILQYPQRYRLVGDYYGGESWVPTYDHLQYRAHAMECHLDHLNSTLTPAFRQKFLAQIDAFNPGKIMSALFKRHSWIRKDPTSDLVAFYLTDVLKESLMTRHIPPCTEWSDIPIATLDRVSFRWNLINQAWLTNKIEGYPLSDINRFYLEQSLSGYASLNRALSTNEYGVDSNCLDWWRLTRIDLFRILMRQYPDEMAPRKINDIICTKIVPYHMSELPRISTDQWGYCKVLLINIEVEDHPFWIILCKKQPGWTVFVPKGPMYGLCQTGLSVLRQSIPRFVEEQVDYENDIQLGFNIVAEPIAYWNTVLLGRVLPWCINHNGPVSQYREMVPRPLMLQSIMFNSTERGSPFQGQITRAFGLRAPMTNVETLALRRNEENIQSLFPRNCHVYQSFVSDAQPSRILNFFDKNVFTLVKRSNQFEFSLSSASTNEIVDAFSLIFRYAIVSLSFTPNQNATDEMLNLFNYDINLTSIKPFSSVLLKNELFSHASECAARNRFLTTVSPSLFSFAHHNVSLRHALWSDTGKMIDHFFRTTDSQIDLDFINVIHAFNSDWREVYCDNDFKQTLNHSQWAFVQMAQMGCGGLDNWFNYLNKAYVGQWESDYKEPAPNISCTLDLSGNAARDNPLKYIQRLTLKINTFDAGKKGCAPLFRKLAFILPKQMDDNCQQALLVLINTLNQRLLNNPNEVNEVVVYNLDMNNENDLTSKFLNQLLAYASQGFLLMIRLPDWDRDAFTCSAHHELFSTYRLLQNQLLDNQRCRHAQVLTMNTENSYAVAQGMLRPNIVFDYRLAHQLQHWDDTKTWYPLEAQSNGIQHQMEQEQEEQQEQEAKQEVVPEPEPEPEERVVEINPYPLDEASLVTRETIDAQCRQYWTSIAPDIQERSGWNKANLSQLFSLWVGSQQTAAHVIEKIEPSAVQKMMQHASKFRLGINKDNLPVGFYLSRSPKTNGLILCFDHEHEKQDLLYYSQLAPKRRNPFKIELDTPMTATFFRGDFRQLKPFCNSLTDMQSIWRCLATEDNDEIRIDNAVSSLEREGSNTQRIDASVVMQRFVVDKQVEQPHDRFLEILGDWARDSGASPPLLRALFSRESDTILTLSNLRSLGQLFYHYDATGISPNGSQHWLHISQQVFNAFGENGFAIWKNRLLDPSQNWSELLNKEEVDAVALSIVTLKNLPIQQRIWWLLVDAHGQAVGHMQYAKVWYAYQKFLNLVSDNHLVIDERSFSQYLVNTINFNAQVFLGRLCIVLKNAKNELYSQQIGQILLNNIDKINWCHDGYYCANHYELYPYWDELLQLSHFSATSQNNIKTYVSSWSLSELIQLPLQHALRFASQRIRLNIMEFLQYKMIVFACFKPLPKINLSLRLLNGCLAVGSDSVKLFDVKTMPSYVLEMDKIDASLMLWLNQQFNLDGPLTSNLIQLHWADVVPFAKAIARIPNLRSKLLKLSAEEALHFINACGRALHSYRYYRGGFNRFDSLLAFAQKKGFDHPLFTDYPWLIDKYDTATDPVSSTLILSPCKPINIRQIELLQRQLRSIQCMENGYWPNQKELRSAFLKIKDAINPVENRHEIVAEWMDKGTVMAFEEFRFCSVSQVEAEHALHYIQNRLQVNFKTINLPLCHQFIQNHLAIETESDHLIQLNEVLSHFLYLDNKAHYNELGQLLGLLITHANTRSPKQFYSASQLCSWIRALINEKTYHHHHYPVTMLSDLLVSPHVITVCNHHLHALTNVPASIPEPYTIVRNIVLSSVTEHAKALLVKLAMQPQCNLNFIATAKERLIHLQQNELGLSYMGASYSLIKHFGLNNTHNASMILGIVTQSMSGGDPSIRGLWERSQVILMTRLVSGTISPTQVHNQFQASDVKSVYINIIFVQMLGNKTIVDEPLLDNLRQKLRKWDDSQLLQLAHYYGSDPRPSIETINHIVDNPNIAHSAKKLIHHFESVVQAHDHRGQHKRHYSITKNDHHNLLRVLAGIKRKGQGYLQDHEQKELLNLLNYTNSYTQVAQLKLLQMDELIQQLHNALSTVKSSTAADAKHYASARLLACMREILLRKTGKWANHTQMLDLLYAAVHNDDSLLHQLQTGQGKSIITVMRTAYLALNGAVVDVFSAKDSLSKRDHQEFSPVFDAMGIRNGYITANSKADEYHDSLQLGIGAVNYATMGNFSLFISNHIWKESSNINLDAAQRVAFLDEADHVLDEQTQFNFSDNDEGEGAYNMDEWVYQATDEFYQEHVGTFPRDPVTNALSVANNPHLKLLCEFLQHRAIHAPEQSKFFERYITPAVDKSPEAIKKRDNQLLQLLQANHKAHDLKEGIGYCIRPEEKSVGDRVIHTRFAKVMIENQIREGSTYSDLVQQFLHVRLNKEASQKGETPNFFVEPSSQIALSLNVNYLLKKYYYKLEGCTGTVGSRAAQKQYASRFGMTQFIKLPTHEKKRSRLLPTEYCDSDDAHIMAIAEHIIIYGDRPLLITCEDDIEVKRIAECVRRTLLQLNPSFDVSAITVDTNDSGIDENDIVPKAGRVGAITFSARMGRGTNIIPETEAGLMVIRTYPAPPSVTKQERGRQGRNGACGTCVDVINYAEVTRHYREYLRSSPKRFQEILNEQTLHLNQKLAKYERLGRKRPGTLEKSEDIPRYLITRSVEQFKHEIKKDKKMYIERKNALIAVLSGNVMDVLSRSKTTTLRAKWIECSKQIDLLWSGRLAGNQQDNDEVYALFLGKAKQLWVKLCTTESALDASIIDNMPYELTPVESFFSGNESIQHDDMGEVTAFHQECVGGTDNAYFSPRSIASPEVIETIYGPGLQHLEELYGLLKSTSSGPLVVEQTALFDCFKQLMKNNSAYMVTYDTYTAVIHQLNQMIENKDFLKCLAGLQHFFDSSSFNEKRAVELEPKEIRKISLLLTMIMNIVITKYSRDDIGQNLANEFITKMCAVILHRDFWGHFDTDFVERIESVFATDADIASLLTSRTNQADLHRLVDLIHNSREWSDGGRGRRSDLCLYLKKEAVNLGLYPETIKPVFVLILAGLQSHEPATKLPTPHCLSTASHELHAAFWHFISQRSPIHSADTKTLLCLLSEHAENNAFLSAISMKLKTLPPYIPLHYINKELKTTTGKFVVDDCLVRMDAIILAGLRWSQFMMSYNLIQSDCEFKHPVSDKFSSFLASFYEMTPERNQLFFETVNEFESINLDVIKLLATVFSGNLAINQMRLRTMLNLVQVIQALPNLSQTFMLDQFIQLMSQHPEQFSAQCSRFQNFVAALKEKAGTHELEISAVQNLWANHLTERCDLDSAIDVIKMAMRLKQEGKWSELFSTIECDGKHSRQIMMQHLEYGLIDLGDEFKARYYNEYKNLMEKLPEVTSSLSTAKMRFFVDPVKQVMNLAKEAENISKKPYSVALLTPSISPAREPFMSIKIPLDYYKEQEAYYASCWYVSPERKIQAKRLFQSLYNINLGESFSQAKYYQAALNVIWQFQQQLLNEDKCSPRTLNTKEYSRLYDISVKIFFKLARDCLINPKVTFEEKTELNIMLHQQLVFHINILHERLPEDSELKRKITSLKAKASSHTTLWEEGTTEIVDLQTHIAALRQSIPKHLYYLLTQIDTVFELSAAARHHERSVGNLYY